MDGSLHCIQMEEACSIGEAQSTNVTHAVVCSASVGGNLTGATIRSSAGVSGGNDFFQTYFSTTRFVVGTVLAALSASSNGLMLVGVLAVRRRRRGQSSTSNIRLMFLHMAATNVVCCATLWLSDNLLFFFGRQMGRLMARDACRFLIYATGAIFVAASFGVMSKLSMLGFSCVQYVSVCHPLRHRKDQVRRKLVLFLVLSWVVSLLVGSLPTVALKILTTRHSQCRVWIRLAVLKVHACGIVIGGAFDVIVYAVIVLLCIGIHQRMRVVRREMTRFRFSRDARSEMKGVATVAAIMSALGFYSMSHIVIHVLSLTGYGGISLDSGALIYYMNMSPYVQLMLEPFVYGLRMHELTNVFRICHVRLDRYFRVVGACSCSGSCCARKCHQGAHRNSPLVMMSVNTGGASPAAL